LKLTAPTWLLSIALLWAGVAGAQTASDDFFADCPVFPAEIGESLRWESLRAPGMLFCRALRADDGTESFALTFSRESPFKPRRGNRAETGNLGGYEVQWYRSEIASDPNALIRETLIRFGEDRVMHVSLRASNQETLTKQQQLVLSLPLPTPIED
jgi:hypothetical protein